MQEPVVELVEVESKWGRVCIKSLSLRTERDILTQVRLEHLNAEERKLLIGMCSDFSDIFYLPGDKLSSTGAAQHSIDAETGTEPLKTRSFRFPEAQNEEVNK